MAGVALARFRFRGSPLLSFVFVGDTLLPFQLLMLPVCRLSNRLGRYDTYWALILIQQDSLKPVTTGLAALMGEYQRSWNILFAATLIAVVPTVVVFVFLQRSFNQGLTMGSGK